jgi:hypothetical protein
MGKSLMKKSVMDRFLSKIVKTDSCWIWAAGVKESKHPYGIMTVCGKKIKAHRLSWLLHFGEIPEGLHVLHKCDNPRCVNPEHLFTGTHGENMKDMAVKGRAKSPHGEDWHSIHDGKFNPRSGENHPFRKNPSLCARGSSSGASKLMEPQVLEIRAKHENGGKVCRLGREYGISHSAIIAIVTRQTWTHI